MSKEQPETIVAPLTALEKSELNLQFKKEWDKVKNDIINGKLSPERLGETAASLYSYRVKLGGESSVVINDMVKDCKDANIDKNNLHQFVSALLKVELDVEKAKKSSTGVMRYSASTLAASFLNLEHKLNGFGKDLIDVVNSGDKSKIIDAYIDIKIPDYLKDHYKPILEFYKSKDSPQLENEAYQNIVFNALNSNIIEVLSEKATAIPIDQRNTDAAKLVQAELSGKINLIRNLSYVAYPNATSNKKMNNNDIPEFKQDNIYNALKAEINNLDESQREQTKSELKKLAHKRQKILDAGTKSIDSKKSLTQKFNAFTKKVMEKMGVGNKKPNDTKVVKNSANNPLPSTSEQKIGSNSDLKNSSNKLTQETHSQDNKIISPGRAESVISTNNQPKNTWINGTYSKEKSIMREPEHRGSKPLSSQELNGVERQNQKARPGPLNEQELRDLKQQNAKLANELESLQNKVESSNQKPGRPRSNIVPEGSRKWVPGKKPGGIREM